MQNMIEVSHLTKHYGSLKALDDLSFTVKQGEILGLLGPNGSGKSTLINCLLSLLRYDHGSIKIMDKEMAPDCYDILDEPTVAVDPQSHNHILEGIRTLNQAGGRPLSIQPIIWRKWKFFVIRL